jgi:hypothetical protein
MGRTLPTFRQLIDDAIARWSKFRRALRRDDQEYFDRLFRRVRSYTQAATYQASDNPMEAILLSIALDHEKRLDVLERAVLPPETLAASTLALNDPSEACNTQEAIPASTRRLHGAAVDALATLALNTSAREINSPEIILEQPDVPRIPDQNNPPDALLQPNPGQPRTPRQPRDSVRRHNKLQPPHTTPWLDFRPLPDPTRDEALADRPEPETPPAD